MHKTRALFVGLISFLSLGAFSAIASPDQRLISPKFTSRGAAQVEASYSAYLKQNPGVAPVGASVGKILIVKFEVNGGCPDEGCFTTVVTPMPDGQYRQVFALRAQTIDYYSSEGPYPGLRVNGIDWDYTFPYGYIADIKSAGKAFVPTLRPEGDTKDQILKALRTSGWPSGVLPLIEEIRPGGGAPTTLMVIPDETTAPGQADCAAGSCHVWFLIYKDGAWVASDGTTGTGLLAILPSDQNGTDRIGVAESGGFFTFSWSPADMKWEQTGSTFSAVPGAH